MKKTAPLLFLSLLFFAPMIKTLQFFTNEK